MLKRILSVFVGVALTFSSILSVSATDSDKNDDVINIESSEISTDENENTYNPLSRSTYNGIFVQVGKSYHIRRNKQTDSGKKYR